MQMARSPCREGVLQLPDPLVSRVSALLRDNSCRKAPKLCRDGRPGSHVKIRVNMLQRFTLIAVFLVVPPVLLTVVVLVTTYLLSVLLATSGFLR